MDFESGVQVSNWRSRWINASTNLLTKSPLRSPAKVHDCGKIVYENVERVVKHLHKKMK